MVDECELCDLMIATKEANLEINAQPLILKKVQ